MKYPLHVTGEYMSFLYAKNWISTQDINRQTLIDVSEETEDETNMLQILNVNFFHNDLLIK